LKPRARLRATADGFAALLDGVATQAVNKNEGGIVTKKVIVDAVNDLLYRVVQHTKTTGRCRVPDLGVLYVATRKGHNISNPVTREPMVLPPTWSIRLRTAKHLKGFGDGPSH